MRLTDILMVLAVLLAPFLAIYAQRQIELWRELRGRKLWVFKTLMATRGTTLSLEHVQALNTIELEFTEKSEDAVRTAWREYHDHLMNAWPREGDNLSTRRDAWTEKTRELLAELLGKMGKSLGYPFDSVQIKRGAYRPEAHGTAEMETEILRRVLLEWLVGDRHVSVSVVPVDEKAREEGKQIIERILAAIGDDGRIKVGLVPAQLAPAALPPDGGAATDPLSS